MKNKASEKGKFLDQVGELNTSINCRISNIKIMRGRKNIGSRCGRGILPSRRKVE